MKFLLGSDPELMLMDTTSNQLRSAIPLIRGTKDHPQMVENGQVIHDNVNIEFGITPAATVEEWVERHRSVLLQMRAMLPPDIKMVVIASADFPASELEHPSAREFACDPDFDPYEMEMNFIEPGAADGTLRSCGGHIHIGHGDIAGEIQNVADVSKTMDVFLGLTSMVIDKDPSSARRRQLYGKAGAHRPKPYGVEYRAIGNFWVASPALTRLVYLLTRDGLEAWKNGHLKGIKWDAIRNIINNNDVNGASRAVNGFVRKLISNETSDALDLAIAAPLATDIEKEWNLV